MGSNYSTDKTSHSCNYQHSFTCLHTSRNTATMNNKFRITRKAGSLFILSCFVFGGCATKSDPTTHATLNFSSPTVPSTTTTTTTQPVQSVFLPPAVASPFDLVAQQFETFVKWRRECSYKPRLCNIGEFTILDTQFSDDFATMIRDYAKNNIYARPGDGERKVIVETISHDKTKMTAIVHGCVYDTVVLYMGAGIYDNKVASSLSSWTMQWHNKRWFWTNYQIHKKVYFQNLCNI